MPTLGTLKLRKALLKYVIFVSSPCVISLPLKYFTCEELNGEVSLILGLSVCVVLTHFPVSKNAGSTSKSMTWKTVVLFSLPSTNFQVTLLQGCLGKDYSNNEQVVPLEGHQKASSLTKMIYYASLSGYMKWVPRKDKKWENLGGTCYRTDGIFTHNHPPRS